VRRSPSQAWFLLAAGIVLVAMAIAAFDLGMSVRSLVSPSGFFLPGQTAQAQLEVGESRALYLYMEPQRSTSRATCRVTAADASGAAVPLVDVEEGEVDLQVDGDRWVARFTFQAPTTGDYSITCSTAEWALAPTFGLDGPETASVVFEWIGRFALFFFPGLILGGVLAGVTGWRRHQSGQPASEE